MAPRIETFQAEVDRVDDTLTLTYVINTSTYELFEWSYNDLEVTGGSDIGVEYGLSRLLYAMGFRYYAPFDAVNTHEHFVKRPGSITRSLTATKQENHIPCASYLLSYGHPNSHPFLRPAWDNFMILNGTLNNNYPAGHQMHNVVARNLDYFIARPHMVYNADNPGADGDPNTAHGKKFYHPNITGQDRVDLVMLCAGFVNFTAPGTTLWDNFHKFNFDPADGDPNSSDETFPFVKDVADQVRAGTTAIHNYPAYDPVPDAQLGVLAYANHSAPPTDTVAPSVYTSVTLRYKLSPLTYPELVAGHGAKSSLITIYDYIDLSTYDLCIPGGNSLTKDNYIPRDYPGYVASGLKAFRSEYSANWLINMPTHLQMMNFLRTGATSFTDALDEVMTDVFADDANVRSIYELISDPLKRFTKWERIEMAGYIDNMPASWYKTFWMKYMVFIERQVRALAVPAFDAVGLNHPVYDAADVAAGDDFPANFVAKMNSAYDIYEDDIMHTYGYAKRVADGVIASKYPYLWMKREQDPAFSTPPDYITAPVATTEADFDAAKAVLDVEGEVRAQYSVELDSTDLVLVTGLTSIIGPEGLDPAQSFQQDAHGFGTYAFYGFPGGGTVSRYDADQVFSAITSYPEGLSYFQMTARTSCRWSNGYVFQPMHPHSAIDNNRYRDENGAWVENHTFIYVPKYAHNSVFITANGSFLLATGGVGTKVKEGPAPDPPVANEVYGQGPHKIPSGVIRISWQSRGAVNLITANKWVSPVETAALMPRTMAERDFGGYSSYKVV